MAIITAMAKPTRVVIWVLRSASKPWKALVLEDDAGEQCIPHRPHRVVIAPVCAHHLKVLHQALVGEMINDKPEPIEIAARFDRVPGKQICFSNGRHGVASLRVASSTTMIPWWPPHFIPSRIPNAHGPKPAG